MTTTDEKLEALTATAKNVARTTRAWEATVRAEQAARAHRDAALAEHHQALAALAGGNGHVPAGVLIDNLADADD